MTQGLNPCCEAWPQDHLSSDDISVRQCFYPESGPCFGSIRTPHHDTEVSTDAFMGGEAVLQLFQQRVAGIG